MSNNRQRLWIPELAQEQFVPEPQFTPSQEIHLTLPKAQMAGYFEVELIEAATGRVKEHYKFPNVITIHAMNAIGSNVRRVSEQMSNLFVGTGNTVPTPNDLKLEAPIDDTADNGGFGDVSGYVTGSAHGPFLLGNPYHFIRKTRVFVEGEANGVLAELGFRWIGGAPEIQFNRALFKNSSGTPITITKTSADQLKIIYEIRMYPPTYQTSGSFVLAVAETTHSWTASAQRIDNGAAWGWAGLLNLLGVSWESFFVPDQVVPSASVPQNPTGSAADWGWTGGVSTDNRTIDSYVCGSFTIRKTSQWSPAIANFGPGGVSGLQISWANTNNFQLAVYFSDSIPKINTEILKLTYENNFTASVTASQ